MCISSDIYLVEVQCSNCGYEGTAQVEKGTELTRAECPKCGCYTLSRSIRPSMCQSAEAIEDEIVLGIRL